MTPHELNSERLHLKVKPSTKTQLDRIAFYDERFASEAAVVRHLLEQHLPSMLAMVEPRIVPEPAVRDEPEPFPAASVPRPFTERLARDIVAPSRPPWMPESGGQWGRVKDELNAGQAAAAPRVGRTPCPGLHSVTESMGKTRCRYCGSVLEGNTWVSEQAQIDAGTA